jgi:hypothetical protein
LGFFSQNGRKKFTISKEILQNIGTLSLKYIVRLDLGQFQEHRNGLNQIKWFEHMLSGLKYQLFQFHHVAKCQIICNFFSQFYDKLCFFSQNEQAQAPSQF